MHSRQFDYYFSPVTFAYLHTVSSSFTLTYLFSGPGIVGKNLLRMTIRPDTLTYCKLSRLLTY